MLSKSIALAIATGILSSSFALADPYDDKYAPPKKAYDQTRRVKLDRPFEVGKPGKKKYDPKETTKTTEIELTQDRPSRTKYTKTATDAKKNYTSKKKYGSKAGGAKGEKYAPIERETVLKYNKIVVEANKRLKTAGKLYGKSLKPIFFDEEADLDEVKEAQDNLTSRVAKVHKVMKAYNVPKTKGSDELAKAHMAFLEYQKEIVEGPLNNVMELLEDPNIKPIDKKEEIQKIFEDIRKQEAQFYLDLKNAQDVYADAHGIELTRDIIEQPGKGKTIKVGDKTIEINGKKVKVNGRQVGGRGTPVRKKTYLKKTETR
jgi:hypothetical protein